MNPNAVFSATLVSSLLLWYPSMQACLRGDLDLTPAALRYLAALAVSRLAMNFLARLINAYRAPQQPEAPAEAPPVDGVATVPPAAAPNLHRRRADREPSDEVSDSATLAA
jgi:hypothetical protein